MAARLSATCSSLLVLFLLVQTPALVVSYKRGIPQQKEICNFRTDHGTPSATNADFEVILMKNGVQASCYDIGEWSTIRVNVISDDSAVIRGFLMGLPGKAIEKVGQLPSGITKNQPICPGLRLFSHAWRLSLRSLDLNFKLTNSSINIRTTVVFTYSQYVEDKQTTFVACNPPTPTSTVTPPTPSTTSTTQPTQATPTPTPTPSPLTCTKNCTDVVTKCPTTIERYNSTMNHTDENGVRYSCQYVGLRHFVFPKNCTVSTLCQAGSVCQTRTFTVSNCSLPLEERKRSFTCKTTDPVSSMTVTKKIKLAVMVERNTNYKCIGALNAL